MSGSKARVYRNACVNKGKKYWDYSNLNIKWGNQDNYEVIRKIGRGKYSEVFEGINVLNNERCVVKVLKPVKSKKVKREIKVLQNLSGGVNVIKLLDVVRDPQSKIPSLITEYVENTDFRYLFPTFSLHDVQFYCYEILKALDFTHSMGIIHRDIKPHNIMIDNNKKILRIIDWGLAEFYLPSEQYNVRVASRYFKGPELLTDFRSYDYSLDLWSFGCMFAGIIFKKEPFFHGRDNYDQLVKICKILGTNDLYDYLETYDLKLHHHYDGLLHRKKYKTKHFKSLVSKSNKDLATASAIDLLKKLLVFDHQKRLTAKEAMKHDFFKQIRMEEAKRVKSFYSKKLNEKNGVNTVSNGKEDTDEIMKDK